jgi:hypothetical protein
MGNIKSHDTTSAAGSDAMVQGDYILQQRLAASLPPRSGSDNKTLSYDDEVSISIMPGNAIADAAMTDTSIADATASAKSGCWGRLGLCPKLTAYETFELLDNWVAFFGHGSLSIAAQEYLRIKHITFDDLILILFDSSCSTFVQCRDALRRSIGDDLQYRFILSRMLRWRWLKMTAQTNIFPVLCELFSELFRAEDEMFSRLAPFGAMQGNGLADDVVESMHCDMLELQSCRTLAMISFFSTVTDDPKDAAVLKSEGELHIRTTIASLHRFNQAVHSVSKSIFSPQNQIAIAAPDNPKLWASTADFKATPIHDPASMSPREFGASMSLRQQASDSDPAHETSYIGGESVGVDPALQQVILKPLGADLAKIQNKQEAPDAPDAQEVQEQMLRWSSKKYHISKMLSSMKQARDTQAAKVNAKSEQLAGMNKKISSLEQELNQVEENLNSLHVEVNGHLDLRNPTHQNSMLFQIGAWAMFESDFMSRIEQEIHSTSVYFHEWHMEANELTLADVQSTITEVNNAIAFQCTGWKDHVVEWSRTVADESSTGDRLFHNFTLHVSDSTKSTISQTIHCITAAFIEENRIEIPFCSDHDDTKMIDSEIPFCSDHDDTKMIDSEIPFCSDHDDTKMIESASGVSASSCSTNASTNATTAHNTGCSQSSTYGDTICSMLTHMYKFPLLEQIPAPTGTTHAF